MTDSEGDDSIGRLLSNVGRHLPHQAPLPSFIHENTLSALEHLSFERALVVAAELYGAEPYPQESTFARSFREGSLSVEALSAVVGREISASGEEAFGLSEREFYCARLATFVLVPSSLTVRFLEDECVLLRDDNLPAFTEIGAGSVHLPAGGKRLSTSASIGLFERMKAVARSLTGERPLQVAAAGRATVADEETCAVRRTTLPLSQERTLLGYPLLISLAAAFLDQGVSYWSMPNRAEGFWLAASKVLQAGPELAVWQRGLARLLGSYQGKTANEVIEECLRVLSVTEAQAASFLHELLLPVRGWAGMFVKLEHQPQLAPFHAIPAKLSDFVAILLCLEVQLRAWAQAQSHAPEEAVQPVPARAHDSRLSLAFEGWLLACLFYAQGRIELKGNETEGELPSNDELRVWLTWVSRADAIERRRLLFASLQESYEAELTSGLASHVDWLSAQHVPEPLVQTVFCIDDREESFRRHVEEAEPRVETFAYPGFFGVAMRFVGAGEARARDLCPAVVQATHRVVEHSRVVGDANTSRALHLNIGSRTLLRGAALSMVGGASLLPLALSVLSPRRHFRHRIEAQPAGNLQFEATEVRQTPPEDLPLGYTVQEMVPIVRKLLEETGLVRRMGKLVILLGHGSTSMNNTHIAGYGCGATAGGCGGPNARVWAQMANHREVRKALAADGLVISDQTLFVGGVHDTSSDRVSLAAPDEVTPEHQTLIQLATSAFDRAAESNAEERCRLFETAPSKRSGKSAKVHVETRASDLSQARPEYNHVRNASAIVGRRKWTRGLFLDQRSFLVSYDPSDDPDGVRLEACLLGSLPVGLGINLEYLFSSLDQAVYGAGSKLPHNVSGLLGVMDGHRSDLRTGLYRQMVEIHEPVRLVAIVEAPPSRLMAIASRNVRIASLLNGGWFVLYAFEPESRAFHRFRPDGVERISLPEVEIAVARTSAEHAPRGTEPARLAHIGASFVSEVA